MHRRPARRSARRETMLALALLGLLAVPLAAIAQKPEVQELPIGVEEVPPPRPIDEAELAGLAAGARAEALTLERAYTLALVKARTRQPELAETLDPKALDEQAAKLGAADFARFRDEFLRSDEPPGDQPGARFRDPSASFFDVLRRRMAVETAWKELQAFETLAAWMKQMLPADPGRVQVALDRAESGLGRARRAFASARGAYRDALDALKVELGLAPHAPAVVDTRPLTSFRELFREIDQWQEDPQRDLDELPRFGRRLGPLENGALDFAPDRPRLAAVASEPARLEPVLRAAESLAARDRGGRDPDGTTALQVRRRVRNLVELHAGFESAKRELVALIRLKDGVFERMVAPPVKGEVPEGANLPDRFLDNHELIDTNSALLACEARLVSLWAAFQVERLALARALRVLPASDWDTFYARFGAPTVVTLTPAAEKP